MFCEAMQGLPAHVARLLGICRCSSSNGQSNGFERAQPASGEMVSVTGFRYTRLNGEHYSGTDRRTLIKRRERDHLYQSGRNSEQSLLCER
nr:uncharacterized protein LOC113806444 isoform X4 [Penaeus vannamei]